MTEVVAFTGGRRCEDCEAQITPARLRAEPRATRCVLCQDAHEREVLRELGNRRCGPHDVIVIRH